MIKESSDNFPLRKCQNFHEWQYVDMSADFVLNEIKCQRNWKLYVTHPYQLFVFIQF